MVQIFSDSKCNNVEGNRKQHWYYATVWWFQQYRTFFPPYGQKEVEVDYPACSLGERQPLHSGLRSYEKYKATT
jgi:hypothetical protein